MTTPMASLAIADEASRKLPHSHDRFVLLGRRRLRAERRPSRFSARPPTSDLVTIGAWDYYLLSSSLVCNESYRFRFGFLHIQ